MAQNTRQDGMIRPSVQIANTSIAGAAVVAGDGQRKRQSLREQAHALPENLDQPTAALRKTNKWPL
jgi:hypothetical protein